MTEVRRQLTLFQYDRGMCWRALIILMAVAIAGCSRDTADDVLSHQEYELGLMDSGLADSLLGLGWRSAAAGALNGATEIEPPYHESGAFFAYDTRALGLAFNALQGQRLSLTLKLDPASTGRLFVQLFYDEQNDQPPSEVAALGSAPSASIRLERDGRYVIRAQPELLATVIYELRLELEASLPFPVSGMDPQTVGSYYGDLRDAGRRRHEGIDIFAPRMTPLLAVVDGVATTRTNRLGGNTVWLRANGRRFYYAHLEEAAFDGRRKVLAGDVLGYVGNSGNARTTPPHLHFGIYRGRRGPIDPLPYLRSQTYASMPQTENFIPVHIRTTASRLNLRSGPAIESDNILNKLPAGTLGRTLSRSGEWLRMRTVDGHEGWIHNRFQQTVLPREETYMPAQPCLVYPEPAGQTEAIGVTKPRRPLKVFGEYAGALLVGLQPEKPIGWLRPARDDETT